MQIEYEATFAKINKKAMRTRLKKIGAKLIKPEFLQKRIVFNLPRNKSGRIKNNFIRVRDEGDKITMTYKLVDGDKIHNQKEINLTINDFNTAVELLTVLGCHKKSYQETKREIWQIGQTEISLDTWPFLEPFIEIESKSEKQTKRVSEKLGFDYAKAIFGGVDILYSQKYKIPMYRINNQTPLIVFNKKNPFTD